MFLRMQGVTEPVATYKRWQTLGRQVVKGAKAKSIVRPITVTKKNEVTGEVEGTFTRFKPVKCLFTASDTRGDPLPPVPEPPSWNVATALEELNIKQVPFDQLDGNIEGYSFERNFAIDPVAAYPLKTTFHEMAHIVLEHTTPRSMQEYLTHRGVKEFQAEATAYLAMNELEVITPEAATVSRGYVQGWLGGDVRPSDTVIRQVFAATNEILVSGRGGPR
jgi:antirestriction protein ArdC